MAALIRKSKEAIQRNEYEEERNEEKLQMASAEWAKELRCAICDFIIGENESGSRPKNEDRISSTNRTNRINEDSSEPKNRKKTNYIYLLT